MILFVEYFPALNYLGFETFIRFLFILFIKYNDKVDNRFWTFCFRLITFSFKLYDEISVPKVMRKIKNPYHTRLSIYLSIYLSITVIIHIVSSYRTVLNTPFYTDASLSVLMFLFLSLFNSIVCFSLFVNICKRKRWVILNKGFCNIFALI